MSPSRLPFRVAPAVADALGRGRPVLALETALLTHGLPRPANEEVFREMTAAAAEEGVVVAAVGVVGGEVAVGLDEGEVEFLGKARDVGKAGLADLPVLLAQGRWAGTTVATSLWAARRAGIAVFATGGIGGVHRGAADSFDLSGDLPALARWGGCVVCSGAKALLDLPKTVEALETLGVAVVGYRTDVLPAFLARDSGVPLRHVAESPEAVVRILRARDALGLAPAVVVANPPPADVALSRETLERAIEEALGEVGGRGLRGGAVTPALLEGIARETHGDSIGANRALLVSNARLGARIAWGFQAPRAPQEENAEGGP